MISSLLKRRFFYVTPDKEEYSKLVNYDNLLHGLKLLLAEDGPDNQLQS